VSTVRIFHVNTRNEFEVITGA